MGLLNMFFQGDMSWQLPAMDGNIFIGPWSWNSMASGSILEDTKIHGIQLTSSNHKSEMLQWGDEGVETQP